jgi:Concanavalin A-like lectin/glucanases superfamily
MQSIVRRIRTIGNFENAGGLFVPSAGVDLARSFNGTSDFIYSAPGALITNLPLTFSCWFQISASGPGILMFACNGASSSDATTASQFEPVLCVNNVNKLQGGWYDLGTGHQQIVGSSAVNDGVWHHALITVPNGGNVQLYLDGASLGTVSVPSPEQSATQLFLGDGKAAATWPNLNAGHNYFDGNSTDAAVWNTVLNSTQISNLASGQRANTIGANANLIDYLPILGQSPEPDESGNGNNGVLTGTTVVAGPPSLQPF